MTATELANKLLELVAKHGDLPVKIDCFTTPCEISTVIKTQTDNKPPYILID